MRWRCAAALAAIVVGSACPVRAGHVLFDVVDRQTLDAVDADAVIPAGRVADLLLVLALREQIASGDLSLGQRLTVLPVPGDRGPHLTASEPVEVGELVQLLLLSDSRTAAKTLASAAGPSIGRCLTRMQNVIRRLGLKHTAIPESWPVAAAPGVGAAPVQRGGTTARELGRVALAVTSDPEIRRRLALDGVPISNGGVIVRATAPLIGLHGERVSPTTEGGTTGVRLVLAERDHLELLVVATGPRADDELFSTLDRGFQRFRRVEVVHEGQAIGRTVRVRGGIIPTFNAVAAEAWAMTTNVASPPGLAFRLQLPEEIEAPVEVHQPLGELVVERNGRVLGVVPLVAPQAIAPSGWLDGTHRAKLD